RLPREPLRYLRRVFLAVDDDQVLLVELLHDALSTSHQRKNNDKRGEQGHVLPPHTMSRPDGRRHDRSSRCCDSPRGVGRNGGRRALPPRTPGAENTPPPPRGGS